MKIRQAWVSNSIKSFEAAYFEKFGLIECCDLTQPVVMFGLYKERDYQHYINHKGRIVVVWCGSDSLRLTKVRALQLASRPATHIAKSSFISADLTHFAIPHIILPISWQIPNLFPVERGDGIFHYGAGSFYGENLLPEIERRTRLPVYKVAKKTLYSKTALISVYANCFIGLRLTKHDGVPNTVVELGMMGRRCIYNGDLPGAIGWKTTDDICKSIMTEFDRRHQDDTEQVSLTIKKFIDISDDWLHVKDPNG